MIVQRWLLAWCLLLFPFYLFPSGVPQLSHARSLRPSYLPPGRSSRCGRQTETCSFRCSCPPPMPLLVPFIYGLAHNGLRLSILWFCRVVIYYTARLPVGGESVPRMSLWPQRGGPAPPRDRRHEPA